MRLALPFLPQPPLVPLLRLQGMIGATARGATLSDAGLAPLLERAFRRGRPAAVALTINSPGGSPVQSALIAARIRRLAAERGLRVHAFVEDVAASGGYWLACAADDIWADPSSIVGSIGVVSGGFGFQDFIARHGVERRLYTSGERKAMLDAFEPVREEDVARLKALQRGIHDAFVAWVRERRGARLADAPLFEGDIWLGGRAAELGLIDGIAHAVPKLKELYGPKVRLPVYRQRRPLLPRLGAELAGGVLAAAEERAHRARFGL